MAELLPDIPFDVRACRIGTCVNSWTRALMPKSIAFDPGKLAGANLLEFVDGEGDFVCLANSTSTADANSSFFALDANFEAKFLKCAASAGFNCAIASKSTSSSQGINCYISYIYKGQQINLLTALPETLYNCATADFQKMYDAVMNATNSDDYWKRYKDFTNMFGHGCVTALHLTSGSAFQITITQAQGAEANSQKYGASFAVNTPIGNQTVAANWGKETSQAWSNATMSLVGKTIPQTSPTQEWCTSTIGNFVNKGLEILSDPAKPIEAPKTDPPKAPEPPEKKEPDKKAPSSSKDTDKELPEDLKDQLMKEDGFEGKSWDEYVQAQKDAYEKLTAKDVVDDAEEEAIQGAGQGKDDKDDSDGAEAQSGLNSTAIAAADASNDAWTLGGFIPFAYEVTPWSELFPDIALKGLPQSFSSIYLAKMYMFFLTRLQFAQYLNFLCDVGSTLCKNDSIANDAANYACYCQDLLNIIQTTGKMVDEKSFTDLVNTFEGWITDNKKQKYPFHSKKVYDKFYKRYGILSESPYGFIMVTQNHSYNATKNNTDDCWENLPNPFDIATMLVDSLRLYPVIDINGNVLVVRFLNNKWSEYRLEMYVKSVPFLDLPVETDDQGHQYLHFKESVDLFRFYFAGFEDIPAPGGRTCYVRGLPMFQPLPFADVRQMASPTQS